MTGTSTTARARVPLTRERALQAAVALADTQGIEAVTMRGLARDLGVEAMSLYHHVANKDDILDGMVDLVFSEVQLPEPGTAWRPAMRERALSVRAAMTRHPWALALMESRTSPGAATLAHHNAVLGCLRQEGFSVEMAAHAFSLLDAYIYGFALQEVTLPFDESMSSEEMLGLVGPMLDAFPSGEYAYLEELTAQHVLTVGYSYGKEFSFGLDLILDGLERAQASQSGP
jgi:AcrR family transcriptional regulator